MHHFPESLDRAYHDDDQRSYAVSASHGADRKYSCCRFHTLLFSAYCFLCELPLLLQVEKNPLENAITIVVDRTEKLRELISSVPIEPHVSSIESSAQGIVMPYVSGGYEKYTVSFFFSTKVLFDEPHILTMRITFA